MQVETDLPDIGGEMPPKHKIITLKELGGRLPIGMPDVSSGGLKKDMAERRWTLKTEKKLGKMRDENRREQHARFVSMVIATLYQQLGILSFEETYDQGSKAAKQSWNHAIASISQMWFGDVLYAWLYLRRQMLGPTVDLSLTCPRCMASAPLRADLDTLEVRIVDKLEDAYWEYELRDPFMIRGKKAERLKLGPARWHVVEQAAIGGSLDVGNTKAALITSSIQHVIGMEDIALTEAELDEMAKIDVETITALIDDQNIGPIMAVESDCLKCKNPFRVSLDWGYDSFFGVSGRSAAQK